MAFAVTSPVAMASTQVDRTPRMNWLKKVRV
jgi:hypothetical protein